MKGIQTILLLFVMILMIGLIPSCVHDPVYDIDDTMNPPDTTIIDTNDMENPCDPERVYFERDILPLFQTNCAFSGCHNAMSAQDGIILSSYESVMSTGGIEPFQLDESDIYEVLIEDDPDKRMPPPPAERLSADDIQKVAQWILQGATNDSCDYEMNCDTSNVRYSVEIQTILESGCISCHNEEVPNASVRLDTYEEVRKVGENGRLLGAIRWEQGYVNMPFGGSQLSDCSISQMEQWIADGMPNN